MRILIVLLIFSLLVSGCSPGASPARATPTTTQLASTLTTALPTSTQPASTPAATLTPTDTVPADSPTAPSTVTATPAAPAVEIPLTGAPGVPGFDHIIVIVFENHNYSEIIGNTNLTTFNALAQQNVLLTQYYAVAHPSLPNYLAMIGGSTFGVTTDCTGCFLDQPSLPDLIEASGRTWKTYQESMSAPCSLGIEQGGYDQNHDPFVYFNPIRKDPARCKQSVVPLTQLDADLSAGQLPNFAFIMPNLCHSAHSCALTSADVWLKAMVDKLQASPALGANSLIVITFDEAGADRSSCCGMPAKAGGRVPTILISPQTKIGFQDATPFSHYSLLKTILLSWNLPGLGESENPQTLPITAPWK